MSSHLFEGYLASVVHVSETTKDTKQLWVVFDRDADSDFEAAFADSETRFRSRSRYGTLLGEAGLRVRPGCLRCVVSGRL